MIEWFGLPAAGHLLWRVGLVCTLLLLAWYTGVRNHVQWQEVGLVYNRTLALYLVEHASAVYVDDQQQLLDWTCSRCKGLTQGFKTRDVIVDKARILQAYVGVSEQLQSVVIAFRGTRQRSIINWIADLRFLELNLRYPGVDDAYVHWGFYASYHNTTIRDRVIAAVAELRAARPELRVAVTGHSLGAAMACLCALDLTVNLGVPNVTVITFGQPRVGNKIFAKFFDEKVPHSVRMTHERDIVVHLPPANFQAGSFSYYHTATEVWIHNVSPTWFRPLEVERICDASGEDMQCSRSVRGTSIFDHLQYLGVPLNFHLDLADDDFEALGLPIRSS